MSNSSFIVHEDGHSKETTDGGLAIDANSPFATGVPGEALNVKAEKGTYLIKPGVISIGIDSLELVSFVVYFYFS